MSVFVNELAPPNARSQQRQCVQQCRRIMTDTLFSLGPYLKKMSTQQSTVKLSRDHVMDSQNSHLYNFTTHDDDYTKLKTACSNCNCLFEYT